MNSKRNKKGDEVTSSSIFSFFNKIEIRRKFKAILIVLFLILLLCLESFLIVFLIKKQNNQHPTIEREYLVENIEMSRYQAAVEYIISCFDNETGGFTREPIRQFIDDNSPVEKPYIWSTWLSFGTLINLNETTKINTTLLVNWIEAKLNDNPDYYGPEDLLGVYKILSFLNETDRVSEQSWVNMIMDDYIEEGGFRSHKDGPAPARNTYFAYILFQELNELNQVNWTKATEYVLSWQKPSGYFSHPLIPSGENIGETVYAYSFLNISSQNHLINNTRLTEIISESFDLNYYLAYRLSIAYVLLDFALINGMSYLSLFTENEAMLQGIKQSQQNLHGNFPFEWKDESFGDIYDTCRAITIFSKNNKLDLLTENITIIHPPLSPFFEISETGSEFIVFLVSSVLGLQGIIVLVKKKKMKI